MVLAYFIVFCSDWVPHVLDMCRPASNGCD